MKETILIVDDEPEILENCRRILEHSGYRCASTSDPKTALGLFNAERPDMVLTDLKMPDKDGLEVLQDIRSVNSKVPVVIFTAFGTLESAVAAIKEGAFDYLAKPISADKLLSVIDRALREKRLLEENQKLKQELGIAFGFDKLVGTSPQLKAVLETVKKVARTEANVLIQGESGTGKELIARAVHRNSARGLGGGRFVPVDCASLPENLLEAELFGHERGAYTDAQSARAGIFESADGGTLFFDEIGEMPLTLQAKMLRVLQERQFRRLGSNRLVSVDFRVIAATNRNLAKEVEEKRFREDLFYRLNVIHLQIPPLRERAGDVEVLAQHFLRQFARQNHAGAKNISRAVLDRLKQYHWPGNVRELENVMERSVSLADGDFLEIEDLPDYLRADSKDSKGRGEFYGSFREAKSRALKAFYRDYLQTLLDQNGGNISKAAEQAGIDRKTIHRLLVQYGIEVEK